MQRKSVLKMRFDNLGGSKLANNAASSATMNPPMKPLPPSMQPKALDATYTPYPLPKHDPTFTYGPTIMGNVPDIHAARRRELLESEALPKTFQKAFASPTVNMDFEKNPPMKRSIRSQLQLEQQQQKAEATASDAKRRGVALDEAESLFDSMGDEGAAYDMVPAAEGRVPSASDSHQRSSGEEEKKGGGGAAAGSEDAETLEDIRRLEAFQQKINEAIAARAEQQRRAETHLKGKDLPQQYRRVDFGSDYENRMRDLVECVRPIDELLANYKRVCHSKEHDMLLMSTVSDLASTMYRQTKEEFVKVLNTIGATFEIDEFSKLHYFQRYWMRNLMHNHNNSRMQAYFALAKVFRDFHYAIEAEVMMDNPSERLYDADVLTAVYRLYAHTQFRNLDSWYSASEVSISNATSSANHAVSPDRHDFDRTSLLWDGMADAIAHGFIGGGGVEGEHTKLLGKAAEKPLSSHWLFNTSKPKLAALLSAMTAADPKQRPDGLAAKRILDICFCEERSAEGIDADTLGLICLSCVVGGIIDPRPFAAVAAAVHKLEAPSSSSASLSTFSFPIEAIKALGKVSHPDIIEGLFSEVSSASPTSYGYGDATDKTMADLKAASLAEDAGASATYTTKSDLLSHKRSFVLAHLALKATAAMENTYQSLWKRVEAEKKMQQNASVNGEGDASVLSDETRELIRLIDSQRGALVDAIHDTLASIHPPTIASFIAKQINLDGLAMEYIRHFNRVVFGEAEREVEVEARASLSPEEELSLLREFDGGDEAVGGDVSIELEEEDALDGETTLNGSFLLGQSPTHGTWEGIQAGANPRLVSGELSRAETVPASTSVRSPFDASSSSSSSSPLLKSPFAHVPHMRSLREVTVLHSTHLATSSLATLSRLLRQCNESGTSALIVSTSTLMQIHKRLRRTTNKVRKMRYDRALRMLALGAARPNGAVFIVPPSEELTLRGPNGKGVLVEDQVAWLIRDEIVRTCPGTAALVLVQTNTKASKAFLAGSMGEMHGASPIVPTTHLSDIQEMTRYYKGGLHTRDHSFAGASKMATAARSGPVVQSRYRAITDKPTRAGSYKRRNLNRWMGKDGGVREKVRLTPTERFGYGMLQGSRNADIRNVGLYAPDFPSFDARVVVGGTIGSIAANNEIPTADKHLLGDAAYSPAYLHPLSERRAPAEREHLIRQQSGL